MNAADQVWSMTIGRTIAAWSNRVAPADAASLFRGPGAQVYRAALMEAVLTRKPVLLEYFNPHDDKLMAVLVYDDGSVEFGRYEEDDDA